MIMHAHYCYSPVNSTVATATDNVTAIVVIREDGTVTVGIGDTAGVQNFLLSVVLHQFMTEPCLIF